MLRANVHGQFFFSLTSDICTLQTTSRTRLGMLELTCDAACEVLEVSVRDQNINPVLSGTLYHAQRVPLGSAGRDDPVTSDRSIVDILSNQCSGLAAFLGILSV